MNARRIHSSLWLTAIVWGAAGCVGPFAPDDSSPSWMVASVVEADTTTRYEGSGTWYNGRDGFSISSREVEGSQEESVVFYHSENARAPSGTYTFGSWDGDHGGFTGLYLRNGPSPSEGANFVITEGSLRITRSTPERIEGSFEFTAALYCSLPRETPPVWPCVPSWVIQGGASVMLEGSFSVGRPGPVIEDGG